MTDFAIEKLGISCPALSRFYVCPRSRFIGCCSEDPCVLPDGVCPQDRMQPTSFDMFSYNMIERHECVFADAQWYTCAYTSPPFLGCCTVNPCEVGECPLRSLRPARMSEDDEASAIFMGAAAPGQIVGGGRDRLTGGDVAGIVMSLMIAVGLVGGLGWWAWKRRRWMAEEERLLMRTVEDKAASVGSLHSQRGYGYSPHTDEAPTTFHSQYQEAPPPALITNLPPASHIVSPLHQNPSFIASAAASPTAEPAERPVSAVELPAIPRPTSTAAATVATSAPTRPNSSTSTRSARTTSVVSAPPVPVVAELESLPPATLPRPVLKRISTVPDDAGSGWF
ncbi:hypothetical protein S7711_02749 [Stachybotrys chartarum IBT 7711]|uniref:Uncharacterized protein n=1 Tax=Stachybotrys chartarum (strain CBS 109288 / IBT 7711) TaxID=1280523 RepID=A0A084ALV6_STACB|nr:hypothetical protein S7711_02749 [Stachybotrys chartarum IBT 7711]KFA49841.1 hypothetical protein S40293_01279 [Stachybotrys chartarum IBT 40293]